LVLNHFVSGRINIFGEVDEAVVSGVDLIVVLKVFEISRCKILLIALKLTRILLADPLQVLRNDIRRRLSVPIGAVVSLPRIFLDILEAIAPLTVRVITILVFVHHLFLQVLVLLQGSLQVLLE
jgi:hypothetical protein